METSEEPVPDWLDSIVLETFDPLNDNLNIDSKHA